MSRLAFHVRTVVLDDVEDLLELWHSQPGRPGHQDPAAEIQACVRKALAGTRERVLVAEHGGRVIGAIYLRLGPLMPLTADQAVFSSLLSVREEFRRHGIARSLMEAAVSWAEENGSAHVLTVGSGSRETNRFLARLGLAPVATVRYAATSSLRARLPVEVPALARIAPGQRSNVGQVLAARRSMRRREGVG